MSPAPTAKGAPAHLNSLLKRISNSAEKRGTTSERLIVVVCNTVIGQMVPDGVVKGGTAMKLRIGEAGSRFTSDIDASRRAGLSLNDYQHALEENLRNGWGGFSGRLIEHEPAEPLGVLELPKPEPVPVLAAEHQIAQKLHACTSQNKKGGNERAHDLVDLQLLVESDPPDLVKLNEVGTRLFAARRISTWPPQVVYWPGWDDLYKDAANGLGVLPTVEEAIDWANVLVSGASAANQLTD